MSDSMERARFVRRLALEAVAFVVLTMSLRVSAQGDATPSPEPDIPQMERCRRFCSRVYEEGTAEHGECSTACGEADRCMDGCRNRFPEQKEKQSSCFRRCMANGRPFEPQAPPELPRL